MNEWQGYDLASSLGSRRPGELADWAGVLEAAAAREWGTQEKQGEEPKWDTIPARSSGAATALQKGPSGGKRDPSVLHVAFVLHVDQSLEAGV